MIREPWHLRYLLSLPLRVRWSPARMARFRDERFRWTVRHAAEAIPFYRRLLDSAGVEAASIRGLADLPRLPIVTRDALREAGQDAWACDVPDSARRIASTSGSSGNPLTLLYHRNERVRAYAVNLHCAALHGWRPWHRTLALGSSMQPPQGTWLQRLGLLRWVRVDPARPVREWVDLYERYRPHTLRGYPSALREFCAEALRRGGLRWRPRALAAVGELYPPEMDELVLQTLGKVPVVLYGAMEAGRLAFGCRVGGGLHVRLDTVNVEILRDDRPAGAGEIGEVVITSFLYACMPFIRYRLGDLARWEEGPCGCGLWWPKIRLHEGRGTDVLSLPDGRRVPITTLGGVVGKVPGLRQYQFVQTGPAALTVRYSGEEAAPAMPAALAKLSAMLPGVEVRAHRLERIGHTRTGKVTRFLRQDGVNRRREE